MSKVILLKPLYPSLIHTSNNYVLTNRTPPTRPLKERTQTQSNVCSSTCHFIRTTLHHLTYNASSKTLYFPRRKNQLLLHYGIFSGNQCTMQRLIIAYNRPKNIGNYTSPRKLRSETTSVSTHLLTTQIDSKQKTSTPTRSMLPGTRCPPPPLSIPLQLLVHFHSQTRLYTHPPPHAPGPQQNITTDACQLMKPLQAKSNISLITFWQLK